MILHIYSENRWQTEHNNSTTMYSILNDPNRKHALKERPCCQLWLRVWIFLLWWYTHFVNPIMPWVCCVCLQLEPAFLTRWPVTDCVTDSSGGTTWVCYRLLHSRHARCSHQSLIHWATSALAATQYVIAPSRTYARLTSFTWSSNLNQTPEHSSFQFLILFWQNMNWIKEETVYPGCFCVQVVHCKVLSHLLNSCYYSWLSMKLP